MMNKIKALFTLIMVLAVMSSLMLVPAYADETSDAAEDIVLTETGEAADSAETPDDSAAESAETPDDTAAENAVEHDHDGDGVADHDADAHEEAVADTTAAQNTKVDDGWTTLSVSDYIAIVVAAVVAVAAVTAIVLLVPKKSKQK